MITTTNITVTCAWLFNFKTITNFDTKDFDKQFSFPGPFFNNFCGILHVKGLCYFNIVIIY